MYLANELPDDMSETITTIIYQAQGRSNATTRNIYIYIYDKCVVGISI